MEPGVPSLHKIIVSLTASVPAMANAWVLTFMATAMYSVMGVSFYRDTDTRNFGTFGKALFTMFQISTGDNWSDIVRTLTVEQTDAEAFASIVFFASYIVLVGIVLMQVVIAVLLEQFSVLRSNRMEGSFCQAYDCNPCPFLA